MSNNNIQRELREAQQKKIDYFCEIINNNNIAQAEYYLNKSNWDENVAIQLYYNKPDYNLNYKRNIQNTDNIPREKIIKRIESAKFTNKKNNNVNINKNNNIHIENNQENKYFEFNIKNLVRDEPKKGIRFIHDKNLLYIKNNLKNVETDFKIFLNKLINAAGIILIYREENIQIIKEQINNINSLREKIGNYIIFPTNSNSKEGLEFSLGLTCISFPSYIFCKYKNDSNIFITDRMEGAFDKSFLENSVYKIISSLNPKDNKDINNLNMKVKQNRQSNSKKKDDKDIFNNIYQQFRKKEQVNKRILDKNKNNNKDQKIPKPIKNNINNYKNDNLKYEINIPNKENVIDNNNNQNKNNIIINNKYDEYMNKIDNFGDFFLGNSIEIPNLFGVYNNNNFNNINNYKQDKIIENSPNNKIIKESKNNEKEKNVLDNKININENDMKLRDSIYNLSDGQILAKREQEMRKLEKMQEEKERKEKEEQKKKEEEELQIKKYEKEAEIAKLILAPEPDDNNPDTCHIKFRLPDGEKVMERKFLKTDSISVLYDYVKSIGREIFMEPDATDFNIISIGFPPKNLQNLKNSTLEKEGLYPNSILQIEEK
jgi:hypothetical protein